MKMSTMDRIIFWTCSHCGVALIAILLYKKYFMGVC